MDGKGKYQQFQYGAIFWHPDVGAFEVHGTIYGKYAQLRCEQGALGYPTSDEKSQANSVDRVSYFQHGSITWTAANNIATEQHVIQPAVVQFNPLFTREFLRTSVTRASS
jgi:uncharacterized protein with LGFP repeats